MPVRVTDEQIEALKTLYQSYLACEQGSLHGQLIRPSPVFISYGGLL